MAAFVGFCLQSNDIVFPWKLTGDISFSDIAAAGGPPDQWDALPTAAKLQILGFIGILELTAPHITCAVAFQESTRPSMGLFTQCLSTYTIHSDSTIPGRARSWTRACWLRLTMAVWRRSASSVCSPRPRASSSLALTRSKGSNRTTVKSWRL